MDWSEKDLCIKCNQGGNLLVCSENSCPLTVHEECLGCPLRFDDEGRFHCPHCVYKQDVAESRRARGYALARKKALLLFMDENIVGGEKHIKKFKRAKKNGCESKVSEVNVTGGTSKLNSDATLDQHIQLDEEHKINNAEEDFEASGSRGPDPSLKLDEDHSIRNEEEERKQEEEHEASAGSKGQDPSLKLDEEHCISIEEEKKNQDEEHETSEASAGSKDQNHEEQSISKEEEKNNLEEHENSSASSGKDLSVKMHKHKICDKEEEDEEEDEEEEEIQEGKCELSSASTGEDLSLAERAKAKRGFKRRKQVDRDSEAVSVRRKKRRKQVGRDSEAVSVRHKLRKRLDNNKQTSPSVNSPRRFSMRPSSAQKTRKGSNEVAVSSKRLKQSEQPSAGIASDIFGCGKRKRLLWTEEEEEALKEGVEKYSKQSNPKFPWRKVLEDGYDKFDPTRTPGDLKVKWRNMSRK